jgi:zinc protease
LIGACKPEISKPEGDILEIQRVTTKQGIEIWLVEDNSHPIIAMNFTFKGAGAINETDETQGTAHLLSNTMDEGAGDLTSQEFQKALSDHSITLRFSSGRDNFGGRLKTLSRNQDKAFELLKLAINEPRFDEEPLQRMKQSNIARIQSNKADPDWIRARLVNDIIYQGHPYARNSGGTLSTIEKISSDDLRKYHKEFLTKDRLVISVVGDIDPETLAKKIDTVFGDLSENKTQETREDFNLQNTGKTFIYKKDIPQSLITMVLPSIKKTDPDHYALKVMNMIYGGGGFGSRLMEEVREKRGLTYGIYSGPSYQNYTNSFRISSSTKNKSAAELIKIVRDEMLKMTEEIDEKEITKAKSYITGSLPLSMSSTDKIARIVQNLRLDNRETDYLDQFADNINAITAEDIKRVAKRILKPENMAVIIVGEPDNIEDFEILDDLPNVE